MGISWFVYLYLRRKASLIDSLLLSGGIAIGLPLILLTVAAALSLPIDIYSIVFSFITSILPPLIMYGSYYYERLHTGQRPSLSLNLSKVYHQDAKLRSFETALGIAFLVLAFAIISVKWAVPAEMDSLIQVGLDPARITTVSQVIAATGIVPPIDYVIHVDPGTTATGALPAQQILDAIALIVDRDEIADILEYKILFFISVGALSVFGITYSITRKPLLAGIAAILFAAAVTNFNPLPSNVTVTALFPLFLFSFIKYIQNRSKLYFVILFIMVGSIFVTYHGGALMTAFVLIIANVIMFVKTIDPQVKRNVAHGLLAVTIWLALIPVFYMTIFETSFSHFVEFFTGYWQIEPISEARRENPAITEVFFPSLYIAGVAMLSAFGILRNRSTDGKGKSSKTIFDQINLKRVPILVLVDIALYLVSGFVIGILVISIYQDGTIGDGIIYRMTRPQFLAFLPITALAVFPLFKVDKEQFFRNAVISAWFATMIIGIAVHSFGYNTNEAAFERTVDLTHPVVAIFAALAMGRIIYSAEKAKLKKIVVIGATPLLFALTIYLSYGGLDRYYHPAIFPDFITHMEEFKHMYNGEVTVYDYFYVNDFIHLQPDIYIENPRNLNERNAINILKDNQVTYVISLRQQQYWDNVLEVWINDEDQSISSYDKIVSSQNITIYKINR